MAFLSPYYSCLNTHEPSQADHWNDENHLSDSLSSVLAELSYGYPEIGVPRKTLDMQEAITKQIKADHNTRLRAWIPLDWARAYLMLNEIRQAQMQEENSCIEQL